MHCKKCGKEIPDDAKSCELCGEIVRNSIENQEEPKIVINNVNTVSGGIDYPYKGKWAAFILCLLLGFFGVHRFYVGKVGTGIIWLLTFGFYGIGWIVDLIMILTGSFRDKAGFPLK